MLLPPIVAYVALFVTVGFLFVLVSLLLGRFLRAHSPTAQKVAAYECGEPAVGPAAVQFDLRFYVVALLFLIFEVEVAFFFPPATIFGRARELRSPAAQPVVHDVAENRDGAVHAVKSLNPVVREAYRGLGIPAAGRPSPADAGVSSEVASQANGLALGSMLDLAVFFAVLLVGFAFVWRRGDLNWVRAVRHPPARPDTAELMARLRRGDV
jgi:NADH-quinone oxidoreductase subunit A